MEESLEKSKSKLINQDHINDPQICITEGMGRVASTSATKTRRCGICREIGQTWAQCPNKHKTNESVLEKIMDVADLISTYSLNTLTLIETPTTILKSYILHNISSSHVLTNYKDE